mgnify:CR=1 FL=1|tara:strand:+ start:114 stop:275 length:162 start_codon:yes stop_codon:yes gene_type:complete
MSENLKTVEEQLETSIERKQERIRCIEIASMLQPKDAPELVAKAKIIFNYLNS